MLPCSYSCFFSFIFFSFPGERNRHSLFIRMQEEGLLLQIGHCFSGSLSRARQQLKIMSLRRSNSIPILQTNTTGDFNKRLKKNVFYFTQNHISSIIPDDRTNPTQEGRARASESKAPPANGWKDLLQEDWGVTRTDLHLVPWLPMATAPRKE